jgi:hypothetical protein
VVLVDPVLDRVAVCDLVLRYARGVDRRDVALIASCFTPDCAYDGTLARGTIADMLAALPAAMARYRATMHFMPGHDVTLEGDRGRVVTPTLAHHVSGGMLRTVAVRYHDDVVRGPDGWRIARRRVERLFERTEDLADG